MHPILVPITFCVTGACALLYELAWTRSFQLLLGSTVYSASAIFAAMLLGFALGSYAASGLADRSEQPLRIAGVSACGIAAYSLFLELLRQLAARHLELIPSAQLLRVGIGFVLILPPAILFGSLWPLILRHWLAGAARPGTGASALYAVNSLGSGLGAFAGGFLLIPLLGIARTSALAAGLNFAAGAALLVAARAVSARAGQRPRSPAAPVSNARGTPVGDRPRSKPLILAVFFASGAAALIYEVTWIRPITTIFSSTIYSVSIILASFMFGLALGSAAIRRFMDRVERPLLIYALVEAAIGLYCLFLLGLFGILNPILNDVLGRVDALLPFHLIQFASVFALLAIPTALMGVTFPLLSQAYIGSRIGKGIGELYASNNAGAILGALIAGFLLLPQLGVRASTSIAAALNFTAALAVLIHFFPRSRKYSAALLALGCAAIYASPHYSIKRLYTGGAFGLFTDPARAQAASKIVFYEEGMYGTIFVTRSGPRDEFVRLLIDGRGSSSTRLNDVRVSTLLGMLPVLIAPEAERALAIGLGTGITSHILARRFETTTVEIEPAIARATAFFSEWNGDVLNDANHTLVFDDARSHLVTTDQRYDIIVNHPLDPFQSFSSLLFTREFLEIARRSLADGGLYVQWLPTYHLSALELRDFFHTLSGVFPHCAVFLTLKRGERIQDDAPPGEPGKAAAGVVRQHGQELIWVCSEQALALDEARLSARYRDLDGELRDQLARSALWGGASIHNLLLLDDRGLEGYGAGARTLVDDRPRLEFTTPFRWIESRARRTDEVALNDLLQFGRSRVRNRAP